MLTENGLEVDVEAVHDLLRRADVLAIGFPLFPERLLIDTRTSGDEGPLVAIVEPVATVQERYLWLGKHRGNFGAPEAFSFFTWPHTVRGMGERDILAPLRSRLADVSNDGGEMLDQALERLAGLEQNAIRDAIKGSPAWRAVWEKSAAA
jgi:hypothetical protein